MIYVKVRYAKVGHFACWRCDFEYVFFFEIEYGFRYDYECGLPYDCECGFSHVITNVGLDIATTVGVSVAPNVACFFFECRFFLEFFRFFRMSHLPTIPSIFFLHMSRFRMNSDFLIVVGVQSSPGFLKVPFS